MENDQLAGIEPSGVAKDVQVQLVAITVTDGSVAVMQFVTKAEFEREATDEAIDAEIVKSGIAAQSWKRIEPANIPSDRTFRNAWTMADGKSVSVDMVKAREIHRERLRRARAPLLEALDVAYQRADEVKDDAAKASVAADKQALRDVTDDAAIEAATTPEELLLAWPQSLPLPASMRESIG